MTTTTTGTVDTTAATEPAAHEHRDGHLALIFEAGVKRVFGSYTVSVTRPEPTTTGGVAAARQRISLVGADGSSLVIGWANVTEKKAELNTLGHTLALSKERYGREIVLRPLEYLRFLETAQTILEDLGMKVTVVSFRKSDLQSRLRAQLETEVPDEEAPPIGMRKSRMLPFYGAAFGAVSVASAFTYLLVAQ